MARSWSSKSSNGDDSSGKFKLKQEIGLATAIALIGGSLIGSGIFMTPGGVLRDVESVGASLCVWGFSGIYHKFKKSSLYTVMLFDQ